MELVESWPGLQNLRWLRLWRIKDPDKLARGKDGAEGQEEGFDRSVPKIQVVQTIIKSGVRFLEAMYTFQT